MCNNTWIQINIQSNLLMGVQDLYSYSQLEG